MQHDEVKDTIIEDINYDRSDSELEYFLMFAICVAGKTAKQIKIALNKFLAEGFANGIGSPFDILRHYIATEVLYEQMKESGLGQYTKLAKAFVQITNDDFNLRECSLDDLMGVHGVGPKTARFFLCYTRPNQPYAILDTHILRYIREKLSVYTPPATPTGAKYLELEKVFVKHAQSKGYEPVQLDLQIWEKNSRGMV